MSKDSKFIYWSVVISDILLIILSLFATLYGASILFIIGVLAFGYDLYYITANNKPGFLGMILKDIISFIP